MMTLTPEQMEVVNDSDAVCEGCGADPKAVPDLDGWFIDSILVDGVQIAQVRCPACW